MSEIAIRTSARFNPLAGIRCFLTLFRHGPIEATIWVFQSPSGDSLFSDRDGVVRQSHCRYGFQSPSGDSLFSDLSAQEHRRHSGERLDIGFNPLAGIRCFLTIYYLTFSLKTPRIRFNPLAGIRCFLTLKFCGSLMGDKHSEADRIVRLALCVL